MNWMIKNSAGKPDGVWTLCVVSWIAVTLLILLSIFQGEAKLGNFSFTIQPVDATLLLGYMAATWGSYVMRRNKKDDLDKGRD